MVEPCYGYILRGDQTGLLKIGITGNLKARMYEYRTHSAENIVCEASLTFLSRREARDWEKEILAVHSSSRVHGEWLRLDREQVQGILAVGSQPMWSDRGGSWRVFVKRLVNGVETVRVFCFLNAESAKCLMRLWLMSPIQEAEMTSIPRMADDYWEQRHAKLKEQKEGQDGW